MVMDEKKKAIFTAVLVSLVGIAAGLFLANGVKPSLAAHQQHDERTSIIKTVRSVIAGNKKTTITRTVQTVIHAHDDLPVHKHVVTVEVAAAETTPHAFFHDFPAAQAEAPVTAAGGSPTGNATPDHAAHQQAPANQILIIGREFAPSTLTVPAGTRVTWQSRDSETHTVTSETGLFNSILNPNASFSFTFANPGTYNYRCDYRPEMTGTIIVQ